MHSPRSKTGAFILEGLNSVAMVYYFLYLYFFMQEEFGFGNMQNLLLASLNGGVYMFAAVLGGRFGQRHGCFKAMRLGHAIMAGALLTGALVTSLPAQVMVMSVCVFGMCFTWPNLEAVVSEGEPPHRLQNMVGIYNLVWSGSSSVAYFTGGAMIETFGFKSIFLVPAAINIMQYGFASWLERQARRAPQPPVPAAIPLDQLARLPLNPRPILRTRTFLRLAWIANPLAYVAMGSLLPVIPTLARKLELTATMAGVFCSVWFFARFAAFFWLWRWPGWHYQMRWLLGAYIALVASFALILLVPDLWVLLSAQIAFGFAVGLIYYSSLFYSMDVGETKAEHGGWHEAAIGAGNFGGPLVGAGALHFFPAAPAAGALTVGAVLVAGGVVMATLHGRYQAS
ncbi:MAG: MFS transporter, partial [Pedosphaera parvula]|nr:MFS transporter [Pedosphaera parvula]